MPSGLCESTGSVGCNRNAFQNLQARLLFYLAQSCLASAMLMMRWCVLALISSATALQLGAAPLASRPVVLARRATFSPIMDESSVDETTSLDAPTSRKGLWSGDKEAPECC